MEDKDRISGCLLGGVAGDEIANGPGLSESTFLALSSANGIIASRGNIEEKTFFSIAGKIARNIEKEYGKNFSESVIDIPIPGRDLLKANCLAGIVPIALFNHDYFFDGIQIAMIGGIIARIIDDNPHSFISAAVLAYIIFRLVEEDGGIGRTEFLGILDDGKRLVANFIDFETGCTISELYKDEMESGNRLMDRAIKMALGNISDNEPILGPSGYQETEEILAISIYCNLKHFNDFSRAVALSAEIAGNRKSAVAVTGNIAGTIAGAAGVEHAHVFDPDTLALIRNTADKLRNL